MKKIEGFQNEYRFLSNFVKCYVHYEGQLYPSVEHAYQAAKALDMREREMIRQANTPGEAKRLGRKVTVRKDWEEIKLKVMEDLLRQKFSEDYYKQLILNTGDAELVEANSWHDNNFGNCTCPKCKNIVGHNHLGKLLMKIRGELK